MFSETHDFFVKNLNSKVKEHIRCWDNLEMSAKDVETRTKFQLFE